MALCRYKDSLGVPGKGAHTHFLGVAVVDVTLTVLGAALLARATGARFLYVLVALFLLGIVLHRVFCVRTTVDRLLFPAATDLQPYRRTC